MKKAFNMKKKHLSFLKGFQLFEFVSDLIQKIIKTKIVRGTEAPFMTKEISTISII